MTGPCTASAGWRCLAVNGGEWRDVADVWHGPHELVLPIIASHGQDSVLAQAIGRDFKGKASLVFYAAAIPAALWLHPGVAGALFVAVALMWLVPDSRIERQMAAKQAVESP